MLVEIFLTIQASIPVRKYEPGTGIITLSVEKEAVMAKVFTTRVHFFRSYLMLSVKGS